MELALELSKLAHPILAKVPHTKEWKPIKEILEYMVWLLQQGDLNSSVSAVNRILPYVQKALLHVERCVHVSDIYNKSKMYRHSLVKEGALMSLENCLDNIKAKMSLLLKELVELGMKLDHILQWIIKEGIHVEFWVTVELSFQMRKITAMIKTFEDQLKLAHILMDLDTLVAGRSFLAHLITYIPLLGSIFSLMTAKAQTLDEARAEILEINKEHLNLQSSLNEWRYRFRAEQRNFLLLVSIKYAVVMFLLLAGSFIILGKAANFMFFAVVVMYFVVRFKETNRMIYLTRLGLVVLTAVMEIQEYNALIWFNSGAGFFLFCKILGFLELI